MGNKECIMDYSLVCDIACSLVLLRLQQYHKVREYCSSILDKTEDHYSYDNIRNCIELLQYPTDKNKKQIKRYLLDILNNQCYSNNKNC